MKRLDLYPAYRPNTHGVVSAILFGQELAII